MVLKVCFIQLLGSFASCILELLFLFLYYFLAATSVCSVESKYLDLEQFILYL